MEYAEKENVVSEIIEKTVPAPDNSAQDYSDVPVYYEPFSYAKENDEVDLYRTSYRLNSECKQAIHEAIADNYDGMYLGNGAVDQVVRQYGMERVGYILANTLHHKSYDDRFLIAIRNGRSRSAPGTRCRPHDLPHGLGG